MCLLDGKYDDPAWEDAIGKSDKSSETIGCQWIANWRHSLLIDNIFALQRKEEKRNDKVNAEDKINEWMDDEMKRQCFIYIGIYLYVIIMSTLVKYKQQRVPSF